MKITSVLRYFIVLFFLLCFTACMHIFVGQGEGPTEEEIIRPSTNPYYHYSLGVSHYLEGNLDEAIHEYEATLSIDPESPSVTAELATLYAKKGKITEAVELLEKSLLYNPDYVDTHLILGSLYLKLRELNNAIKEYKKVLELDPTRLEAYLYLSAIYRDEKNYKAAIEMLRDFLKIEPDNAMGRYYLGKIYADMKLYDQAEKWFNKTLDIKPYFESALLDLAMIYESQNKKVQSIKIYKQLINHHPSNLHIRLKLGKTYLELNEYEKAAREFNEILKMNSSSTEARFSLGLVYFFEGKDYDRAMKEFLAVLKKDPTNDRARYFLASSYREKGRHDIALKHFEKIPSLSKLYSSARIRMGDILKEGGQKARAISLIRKAIDHDKKNADLYDFLSSLYEDDNNLTAAEETAKQGLAVSPQSIILHYRLGLIYEKAGRREESITAMEKVLKIDPRNAEALNFIGYSFADSGIKLEEAEKMIQQALTLKPENGYITDSLGWVYFKQKKWGLAIKYLRKAAEILPEDPTIAEHLGDAYEEAGLFKEALNIYRKALTLHPKEKKTIQQKIKKVLEKMKTKKMSSTVIHQIAVKKHSTVQ
ncbi:MAG: tetratricopeptide repeat protein [Deltaproteobacteria bacterium]|nr:tetratricopeptide repeat protein [Deltaproteobacteria bacterium]